MPLVLFGKIVLAMHSTLIGYAIGYLPNQVPPGYPGLLILANWPAKLLNQDTCRKAGAMWLMILTGFGFG